MANGKRQTSDKISLPFSGRLQGVECRVPGAGGGCCSSLVVLTSTALLMHSHSQPALTSLLHFAFIWLNVLVWFLSYACGPRTRSHATSPSPSPSAIPWYFHVSKFVQVKFARWWWCYEWLWVCHRRAAVKQATSDHINEAFARCLLPRPYCMLPAAVAVSGVEVHCWQSRPRSKQTLGQQKQSHNAPHDDVVMRQVPSTEPSIVAPPNEANSNSVSDLRFSISGQSFSCENWFRPADIIRKCRNTL